VEAEESTCRVCSVHRVCAVNLVALFDIAAVLYSSSEGYLSSTMVEKLSGISQSYHMKRQRHEPQVRLMPDPGRQSDWPFAVDLVNGSGRS
jgi:hypothetical protein